MASVYDVANFFIRIANLSEDEHITNLKLNKLLYFAQGVYLSRFKEPLFPEAIEVWDLGPVVPEIYHKYKALGKSPIYSKEDINRELFTDDEFETLLDVTLEYGKYTGSTLVSITHMAGSPWSNAKIKCEKILDQVDIRDYFIQNPIPYLEDKISVPHVLSLPFDWYDSTEDAEWEDYL